MILNTTLNYKESFVDINVTVAREVLGMYGDPLGWMPGSFGEALITTFMKADAINFAKLSVIYPDYGSMISLVKNHENGIDELRELVATK